MSLGDVFSHGLIGEVLGMGDEDAPNTPNYRKLAKTQAKLDRKTAQEITGANRPNQYDPMGNAVEWELDKKTGQWTQRQKWAPGVKQQYMGQTDRANQAGGIYGGLLGQIGQQDPFQGPEMPTYDPNSGKAVSDATYGLMTDRLIPQQQKDTASLDNRLRLQGLVPGTKAYNDAAQNLSTSQGDVLSGAANQATVSGYEEARQRYLAQLKGQGQDYAQQYQTYKMPWDLAGKAANLATDRYTPSMPGFTGATGYNARDVVGAGNAAYNTQMQGYNTGQEKKGQTLGTAAQAAMMFI
jgi:hypothetical protein